MVPLGFVGGEKEPKWGRGGDGYARRALFWRLHHDTGTKGTHVSVVYRPSYIHGIEQGVRLDSKGPLVLVGTKRVHLARRGCGYAFLTAFGLLHHQRGHKSLGFGPRPCG